MKYKQYFPLIFITLIAATLRFFDLSHLPISLNWDEVSHGYNAYSILKTGKDEWGRFFPLIFRAFGDYKLPVYIYLTVLPVFFFGLNAFAVRFVSALAGTLAIPGIYFLTKELFPTPVIARSDSDAAIYKSKPFLAATILTFLPWHFFISRPALEANLSLTLIIFGSYYLLRFAKGRSSLLPAAVFLGLSLHTYNTARVFVPLLVVAFFFIYRPSVIKNLLATVIFGASLLLVSHQIYLGEGTARYNQLKILSEATVFQIGQKRAESDLPPLLAKAIYNRPVFFITTTTKNYLSYFSPAFFYQKWGAQFQFAIPKQHLLTLPIFLLAFLGFFTYLASIKTNKDFQFLYCWIFLSPLAASLTIDPPQALRPNPMIPALIILACLGLGRLLTIIPPKKQLLLTSILFLWVLSSFGLYLKEYVGEYKTKYSSSWQYGYQQVMEYLNEHSREYEKIFITKGYGEPHIFYAFFTKLDPQEIQPGPNNIRFNKSDWFWTDKIDNVYFVNDWQIPTVTVSSLKLESGEEISTQRSLLITLPEHIPVNAHVIDTIQFPDGSPAFIITSVP